jgi:hypothetical protein
VLAAGVAHAAAPAAKTKRAPPPPPVTPVTPATPAAPEPEPPAATPPVGQAAVPSAPLEVTTQGLLELAQSACRQLEYDVCGEHATAALARADITSEQQALGYMLQASALAIQGQSVEAERPYRLLLRMKPEYDLPKETAPKILAVFRKVQAEENEIRLAVKASERKKLVESLRLGVTAPPRHKGGTPLHIRSQLVDPMKGVASVVLEYRMGGTGPFATLPMQATPEGPVASFTAAQTSTDAAVRMEYRVVLRDVSGETLLASAPRESPNALDLEAGQVVGPTFWKQPRFWLMAGGGAGGLGTAALLFSATVFVVTVVGAGALYLLLREDAPAGKLGKQYV